MNKTFSFIAGAIVGATVAAMICDENKKRIKTTVSSYIDKMRSEYEGPVLEAIAQLKDLIKKQIK